MKKIIQIAGKLTLICLVAGISLALVNSMTKPVIAQRKLLEEQKALDQLKKGKQAQPYTAVPGPSDENIQYAKNVSGYYAIGEANNPEGYILKVIGQGYAGNIVLLAYIQADGEIIDVISMENIETPGLGSKATTSSYMEKFRKTGASSAVPTKKSMLKSADADAVSGASVTFSAIGRALNAASTMVKAMGGK